MKIEFATPRGAKVEITPERYDGFSAEVNGKPHTFSGAKFVCSDADVGPHVRLAGNVKAQVPADRVAEIEAWFAAAKVAQAEALKEANAQAAKDYSTENRMRDMESRWSVN